MPDTLRDPAEDSFARRLEVWTQDLLDASTELGVRAIIRGEPFIVPTALFPFASLMIEAEGETTENNEGRDTGPTLSLSYPGHVTIETLLNDAPAFARGQGVGGRKMVIPSHEACMTLANAARNAMMAATTAAGLLGDAVVSASGKEKTSELYVDEIRFAVSQRPDSVSNTGSFKFHITTRRREY